MLSCGRNGFFIANRHESHLCKVILARSVAEGNGKMRRIYLVQTRVPILTHPKGVNVLGYSLCTGIETWLTFVSVPNDTRHWDNFRVLECFAHEGCFSSQFVTFGKLV